MSWLALCGIALVGLLSGYWYGEHRSRKIVDQLNGRVKRLETQNKVLASQLKRGDIWQHPNDKFMR